MENAYDVPMAAVSTQGPARTTTPRPGKRRRRSPGWVPEHHGAWAMITVPVLVGVVLGGPSWFHVPLLALWWIGYFAFYATGLWLRARRRARYLPPVRAYAMMMIPFAVALLLTSPFLLVWALPFAPLVATTLWCSVNRKDRTMLNDVVTVGAAGLTTAVAYDVGVRGAGGLWGTGWLSGSGWLGTSTASVLPSASVDGALVGWAWAWLVTLLITAYFIGTILYIKTNIRERGNRPFMAASAIYHVVWFAVAAGLAAAGPVRWAHAVVWALLVGRAIVVQQVAVRRHAPIRPMFLGIGEIAASIAIALTLLV